MEGPERTRRWGVGGPAGPLRACLALALGTASSCGAEAPPDPPRRAEVGPCPQVAPDGGAPRSLIELGPPDEAVAPVSVLLDGQARRALAGRGAFAFARRVTVPAEGRLVLGLNRDGGESPIACRVALGGETLLEVELLPDRNAWSDHGVDLDAYAGREVELRFSASPAPGDDDARVFWSELCLTPATRPLPNVLLVLVDTLRPDHLGCYGYGRDTSPVIDGLAEEGVLFRHARSVAPWTDPSILALHSGLHPSDVWRARPHDEAIREVVPSGVRTLAEELAAAGWTTLAASDHPGIHAGRFGQGFDVFAHLFHVDGPYRGWRQTADWKVRRQVRELVEPRARGGLFLYLHVIYPHRPYRPPEEHAVFGPGDYEIDEANKDGLVNLYDGEIRRTDRLLGRVLEDLGHLGFLDDAIVVLLSDHGEAFWEHGHDEHGDTLYDEVLAIPLVIHAPGRLEPGVVDQVVGIVDVLPTVLDLVGLPVPDGLRGTSLVPAARGEALGERLLLSEFPHSRIVDGRALQSASEKLIDEGEHGQVLFFDLLGDPGELEDLAPRGGERLRELARALAAVPREPRFEGEEQAPSEEMLESLRALGYTE